MTRRIGRRWIAAAIGVCLLGFLGRNWFVTHERGRIVERIRKAGGRVVAYKPFVSTTTPRPLCNRIVVALDILGRLFMVPDEIAVDLRKARADAELLGNVARLVQVRSLYLTGPNITDETLKYVAKLTRLRCLSLVDTRVTGSGLRYLASLPDLEQLDLAECPLHDSELKYVNELRSLRVLDVTGTKITDRVWSNINNLVHLNYLIVFGTDTTEENMVWSGKNLPRDCIFISARRL